MLQNTNSGGFSVCFLRKDVIFQRKITRESTARVILQHLFFISHLNPIKQKVLRAGLYCGGAKSCCKRTLIKAAWILFL